MTSWYGNQRNLTFRPPFGIKRRSTPGGRWNVRRLADLSPFNGRRQAAQERPWKAYSRGKARYFDRRFATHAEAIQWAQRVANAYLKPKEQERTLLLRQLQLEKYPHLIGHSGKYSNTVLLHDAEFRRAT